MNTSDFEGFPNTFVEAALEKTPVVSFKVDPNKMFEEHCAGICCYGNFENMVVACKQLVENDDDRLRMGENARSYAEKFHDIDIAIFWSYQM